MKGIGKKIIFIPFICGKLHETTREIFCLAGRCVFGSFVDNGTKINFQRKDAMSQSFFGIFAPLR